MPSKPLPKGIEKEVDELEKVVSEFTQLSENLLRALGASDDEVKNAMRSSHNQLSAAELQQIKRSQVLMSEARRKHAQLGFIIRAAKERGDIDLGGGKKTKSTGEARRKKFRRVGGKKRWMPL